MKFNLLMIFLAVFIFLLKLNAKAEDSYVLLFHESVHANEEYIIQQKLYEWQNKNILESFRFVHYSELQYEKLYEQNKNLELIENLNQNFKDAQTTYLSEDLQQAITKYQKIADSRWESSWPENSRISIIHSLLRLAQIDKHSNKDYIQEAVDFEQAEGIDFDYYPPHIAQKFALLKQHKIQNTQNIRWANYFPNFDFILVNGKKYHKTQSIASSTAKQRFELFSSKLSSIAFVGSSSELISSSFNKTKFLNSSCMEMQSNEIFNYNFNYIAIYNKDCIWLWNTKLKIWQNMDNNLRPKLASSSKDKSEAYNFAPSLQQQNLEQQMLNTHSLYTNESREWTFIKNHKWWILGISALSLYLAHDKLRSEKNDNTYNTNGSIF